MPYRHILAVVDLEAPIEGVLQRAALLARAQKAKLTVAAVVPDLRAFYRGIAPKLQQQFELDVVERARERLKRMCDRNDADPDRIAILRGEADAAVAQCIDDVGIDLVVFGNNDPHGLEHYIGGFGSGLLHRANCDLLAVCDAEQVVGYELPLVALNVDDHVERLIARSREICPEINLLLLHVIRPVWGDYKLDPLRMLFGGDEERERMKETVDEDVFRPIYERYRPVKMNYAFGTPSVGIKKQAKRLGADLIIMSSGKPRGVGWHVGSTANNVIAGARLDVLVIRPAAK